MTAAGWLPWALLSALFAALTAILAKIGVEGVDPDFATLFRTLVVAAVLGFLLVLTERARIPTGTSWRSWIFLVLSGLATGASWLCYFRALRLGDAARVAPVDKLSVVLVAVVGVLALGEHLSMRGWIGVVLVAVGALAVATS